MMPPTNISLNSDVELGNKEEFGTRTSEANLKTSQGLESKRQTDEPSLMHKFLCYPTPSSLKLRSTSWLDGVRGIAALEVYLFHVFAIWLPLVHAWHADPDQVHILQMPFLRTFFVSGGTAVSLFFAISGYVLTHKAFGWMRSGSKHLVYPAVASSMFRRGFRLYLPPIILTFFEMISTRFGYVPPLNFTFTPEPTFFAQCLDWVSATNRFVNPFNTYGRALHGFLDHPKYDAVVWTIPLEFYGSLVCYTLLILLARVPGDGLRMGIVAIFACFCLSMGSWNLFCFSTGMLIADFNLGQGENPAPSHPRIWTAVFIIAFYVCGFPALSLLDAKTKPMPGFETLRSLTPMSLNIEDNARFWWSLSSVLLLLSISQLPRLKKVFETSFCQYVGKISFSLYLVHEFCLVLYGLRWQEFLMHVAHVQPRANTFMYWLVCGVWLLSFTFSVFVIAAQVERWVDVPSVKFAKWLEGKCLKTYRRL
jgi:peptidoglycan/LPS O-acetylase OafA/YrhL